MMYFSLKSLLLGIFVLSFAGVCVSQYQQECHSLDSVIDTLIRNLETISMGTVPSCTKSADCTSLSCSFDLMGRRVEMKIILSPCTSPPQMTFILQDASGQINLETNITHQTTFPLPSIGFVESSIRVDFQPVPTGVQFGLFLVSSTLGVPVTTPIVPDQVISTPPCDSSPVMPTVPVRRVLGMQLGSEKCTEMDDTLAQANIPNGFNCYSYQDCNGFHCNGTQQTADLQISLRMDPCSTPVSYNITITSNSLNLAWSHNVTHTEDILIMPGPPLEFRLYVIMNPDPDAGVIFTTIKITGCTNTIFGQVCPIKEALINNQPLPVPPCVQPTSPPSSESTVMATTPDSSLLTSISPVITDECSSWAKIIHDMGQSASGLGQMSCNVTTNCTGIVCNDMFSGEEYVARLDLRHCMIPVELWMSVKSESGSVDWQTTITHNETFDVPGAAKTASFVVTLDKPDDDNVELGLDVQFTAYGFSYSDTLIQDQLIPVEPCNGTNPTVVAMTTSNTGGKTEQTPGKTTMSTSDMTTALIGNNDKPNKVPIADEGGSNNIGIVFGVLLAGMVVLCVIAGLLYVNRRRRYHRADETALVEDSFAEI